MSENISLPFYFKFGASDVLSGLESTHGTRSILLFSARRRPCPLCWRAGKALSIYPQTALSATTSRFPDRPRPMLHHSSCSALLPSLAAPLMRECESRINAPPSPTPAATPWTRSRTTSGSRATSVFSGSIGGFRLGKRVQRPNDRVQKSTTEQKNRTEHAPDS